MSGLMTPESLSREGSPGPDGGSITLHPAPQQSNNGIIMSNDSPAQVVASHLEVKTNNFTPGVHHHPTGHLLTTGTPPSKFFVKLFDGSFLKIIYKFFFMFGARELYFDFQILFIQNWNWIM